MLSVSPPHTQVNSSLCTIVYSDFSILTRSVIMLKSLMNMSPQKAIQFAPLILFIHFYFEEAPNFVDWLYTITSFWATQELFFKVNLNGLFITMLVALIVSFYCNRATLILAIIWLSFLMFANSIFHLTSTVVYNIYSPGSITSVILYLPYFIWFIWLTIKYSKIKLSVVIVSIVLGCLPMFLMTYPIVFEGRHPFAK